MKMPWVTATDQAGKPDLRAPLAEKAHPSLRDSQDRIILLIEIKPPRCRN